MAAQRYRWYAFVLQIKKQNEDMTVLSVENSVVKIDKGELVSYVVNGYEYMHQKGKPGWRNVDTEMFPIIGSTEKAFFRVQTPKGTAVQDQHGLLREMEYTQTQENGTSAVFCKKYQANTKIKNAKFPTKSTEEFVSWPYDFEFTKSFDVSTKALRISFSVDAEETMPFMLGYHPAFRLQNEHAFILVNGKKICLEEVFAAGHSAFEIPDANTVILNDHKRLRIATKGFTGFMLWTEVSNMICVEPITFYPYRVAQKDINKGFITCKNIPSDGFEVVLTPL